jgi:hypothetical protein
VWHVQTLKEFADLSTKLTNGAFFFTGLELFESLNSEQLSTLLKHPWKSRQKETDAGVDDIEIDDENGKRKGYIAMLGLPDKAQALVEETVQKHEQQAADKTNTPEAADIETLHCVTDSQKKAFETVSFFCKEMCALMNLDTNQLAQSPACNLNPDPFDTTNLPHTVEVLRLKLTSHLKGLIEENQRQDQNYAPSGAHIQLHEHTIRLKNIRGGMTCHGLLLELTRKESLLRRTLAEQVSKCVFVGVCVFWF